MDEILNFFPEEMKQKIKQNLLENLEEIRIRTNKPIILRNGQAEKQIPFPVIPTRCPPFKVIKPLQIWF